VDLHYSPRSELTRPAAMLGVLKGLRRRGLRAFSVQPNIWLANNGHDVMAYSYLQVCTSPIHCLPAGAQTGSTAQRQGHATLGAALLAGGCPQGPGCVRTPQARPSRWWPALAQRGAGTWQRVHTPCAGSGSGGPRPGSHAGRLSALAPGRVAAHVNAVVA
jgi:hypothetical protein